jgi:hypothetical protein
MNVENVRKLRDLLREVAEKNPKRFNMNRWFGRGGYAKDGLSEVRERNRSPRPEDCGTAACMAGWCQLAFAVTEQEKLLNAMVFAKDFCGIDRGMAHRWFVDPAWSLKLPVRITATEAADFLTDQLRAAGAEP